LTPAGASGNDGGVSCVVLTIAGSDPSGGAGLQADLKVFHAHRCWGAAVVTALTVQDTTRVHAVEPVAPALVAHQLDVVLADLDVRAAKTGMLGTPDVVDVVAARFAARPPIPLVVDPVLVASAGQSLAAAGVVAALRTRLLPVAALVTPNLAEAEALLGRRVADVDGMRDAARALVDAGARAALVTGGHLPDRAVDVLYDGRAVHVLDAPRLHVGPTHGTGCALSAAIVARLAAGDALVDAVAAAKRWTHAALAAAVAPGHGRRSPDHGHDPDGRSG